MRYLLVLAMLLLGLYVYAEHQTAEAGREVGVERPTSVSIDFLTEHDDRGLVGHAYAVTGTAEAQWRVGDLIAVKLGQYGHSIIVVGKSSPASSDGQLLSVVVRPKAAIPFGGSSSPIIFVVADWTIQ